MFVHKSALPDPDSCCLLSFEMLVLFVISKKLLSPRSEGPSRHKKNKKKRVKKLYQGYSKTTELVCISSLKKLLRGGEKKRRKYVRGNKEPKYPSIYLSIHLILNLK